MWAGHGWLRPTWRGEFGLCLSLDLPLGLGSAADYAPQFVADVFDGDMIFSLIGRPDGGYSGSRDFGLPIVPCKVSNCPCNRYSKCISPANIDIGADGRCVMAKKVDTEVTPPKSS